MSGRRRPGSAGRSPRREGRRRANRLTGVGLVVLLAVLALMALGPLENYTIASDRVEALEAQREELAAQRDELAERRAALATDDEIEILARSEYGMVRPGEVPFVVVEPTPDAALTPKPTAPTEPSAGSADPWWRRLGHWLSELTG